jgi:hypothetical protein
MYMDMSQINQCIAILNNQKCCFLFNKIEEQEGRTGSVRVVVDTSVCVCVCMCVCVGGGCKCGERKECSLNIMYSCI